MTHNDAIYSNSSSLVPYKASPLKLTLFDFLSSLVMPSLLEDDGIVLFTELLLVVGASCGKVDWRE